MLTFSRLLGSVQLDREEGQVLPMFAAAILGLLLMTAVVTDGGNLFQARQSLQNAADSAALAAALAVFDGDCTVADSNGCQAYADLYARANGVSGDSALVPCPVSVTPTKPPAAAPGCYLYPYVDRQGATHYNQVEVWLTKKIPSFFGVLPGIETFTESARAVATAKPSGARNVLGVYIYSSGDVTLTGGAHIQEPIIAEGNLFINGNTSVDSIARLVAIGLSGTGIVKESGGGTLGDGQPTSLTATLLAANKYSASVLSTPFSPSGTVFVAPNPASCTVAQPAPPCEWIEYAKTQGGTRLKGLTRGYGGYNALPASQHASGDSVDPRIAVFWAPRGKASVSGSNAYVNVVNKGIYDFTPPTFNLYTAFGDAELGPNHTCSVGSVPPGFFGAGSVPQDPGPKDKTDLTPKDGYICMRLDASNNVIGEIAWGGSKGITLDKETVPAGELRVIGTIFLNANLKISHDAIYQVGSAGAVIWSTGGLSTDKALLANCGTAASPVACGIANWNPNLGLLGIVAHKVDSVSSNCIALTGGAGFQGAMYADGGNGCTSGDAIKLAGSGTFQGVWDGKSVTVSGATVAPSPTITDLPQDFPSGGGSAVSLVG